MQFIVGMLIGMGAAFMLAPKKGTDFRRDLEMLPETAREMTEDVRERIDEAIKAGKEAVARTESELKEEAVSDEQESPEGT